MNTDVVKTKTYYFMKLTSINKHQHSQSCELLRTYICRITIIKLELQSYWNDMHAMMPMCLRC